MKMNKLKIITIITLLVSNNLYSATMTITGSVSPGTCSTGVSDNYTFDLGDDIGASTLQVVGSETATVSHDVVLGGCPAGMKSVTATFTGTPYGTSNFQNGGTAKNIAINISDTLGVTYGNNSTMTVTVDAAGNATFPLQAKGVSTGNTTVGTISTAVVLSFTYN
ncbi:hypothetical protein KWI07_14865 [Enterobacter bugandensis]|uniref:fimbrial protein n=1 Tax=Enterobacter bugandensis TaxID=881260 RepID=UPI0021D019C4|nr:hypothetical protein [Enterobacter bugandensis]MCU6161714.1 hypothetical protein [Enterobacter bugandensis]